MIPKNYPAGLPATLNELAEYEQMAHETNLRHEALRTAWRGRNKVVLQKPPPVIPKISAETFIAQIQQRLDESRARREGHY